MIENGVSPNFRWTLALWAGIELNLLGMILQRFGLPKLVEVAIYLAGVSLAAVFLWALVTKRHSFNVLYNPQERRWMLAFFVSDALLLAIFVIVIRR